jgi:hypothetical protein
MVKKYYDFKFELNIDGQPHPPEGAALLFQRDPFPGGHQYSCVIFGKRLGKYFYDVPLGSSGTISEQVARNFFHSLGLSWLSNAGVQDPASNIFSIASKRLILMASGLGFRVYVRR